MPVNVVKTKDDEALWDKAKRIVNKQYPQIAEGSERYYKLVMGIYQKMKGKDTEKTNKSIGGIIKMGGIREYLAKSGVRGETTRPDANDAMGGTEEIKSIVTGKVEGLVKQVLDGSWSVRFNNTALRTKQRGDFATSKDAMAYAEKIIGSYDRAMGGDKASKTVRNRN